MASERAVKKSSRGLPPSPIRPMIAPKAMQKMIRPRIFVPESLTVLKSQSYMVPMTQNMKVVMNYFRCGCMREINQLIFFKLKHGKKNLPVAFSGLMTIVENYDAGQTIDVISLDCN